MNLLFSEKIQDKPTYDAEKIISALVKDGVFCSHELEAIVPEQLSVRKILKINKPKTIEIIEDKNDIWKVGMKINAIYHNGSKERFQFIPVFYCKSIQKIEIAYNIIAYQNTPFVYVDDQKLNCLELEKLAINKGKESIHDFFRQFPEDFTGKIIGWTDYKY